MTCRQSQLCRLPRINGRPSVATVVIENASCVTNHTGVFFVLAFSARRRKGSTASAGRQIARAGTGELLEPSHRTEPAFANVFVGSRQNVSHARVRSQRPDACGQRVFHTSSVQECDVLGLLCQQQSLPSVQSSEDCRMIFSGNSERKRAKKFYRTSSLQPPRRRGCTTRRRTRRIAFDKPSFHASTTICYTPPRACFLELS